MSKLSSRVTKSVSKGGLAGLCAAFLVTALVGPSFAADPIRLGVITSRSGVFSFLGTAGEQGVTLAAEEINAKGGVLGRPLELVKGDDASKPEETGRLFREQASSGVFLIIGNVASPQSAAASTLAKEEKIPFFTDGGYARFLTEEAGHRYFFRLLMNVRGFYVPIARQLAKQGYKRYCSINNDFEFGHDVNKSTLALLQAANPQLEIVPGCEFWVPLGATDFAPFVTAILSKQPDVLLFSGLVQASARAFLSQANSFGLFRKIVGAHASLGNPANVMGVRQSDIPPNISTAGDYPYPVIDRPANVAFLKNYEARWKMQPLSESETGYTTMYFIAKAIEKAGKLDREAFIDAAEGLSVEAPAAGEITLRSFDHQGTHGSWTGRLTWDAKDNRAGMENPVAVSADTFLPSEDEVKAARAKPTQ